MEVIVLSAKYIWVLKYALTEINIKTNNFSVFGKITLLLNENIHQQRKLPPVRVGTNKVNIPAAIFKSLSKSVYMLSLLIRHTLVKNLSRQE